MPPARLVFINTNNTKRGKDICHLPQFTYTETEGIDIDLHEHKAVENSTLKAFLADSPLVPDLETTKEDERLAGIVAVFSGLVLGIVYIATSMELILFLFLAVVLFYLGVWVLYLHHWIYPRAEIEGSLLYEIAASREGDRMDQKKKEKLRKDWQHYRRGYSRYGEFVDLKLEHKDFSSPLTDKRKEEVYEKYYSKEVAFDLKEELTKDRLKGDENLYLHFVGYYYDEFKRQVRQREEAGLGPKVEEELVEQERRKLKELYAGQRVEREAAQEMFEDVLRAARRIGEGYRSKLDDLEEDDDLTEEEKEWAREDLQKVYKKIKKRQAIKEEEEEETDRYGYSGS